MKAVKHRLLFLTIFVSQSIAHQSPDIYINDVGFMVGIFEIDENNANKVHYVSEAVLISPDQVITSSISLYDNLNYVVRAYNWPKNTTLYADKRVLNTDYHQRKVKEYQRVNSTSLLTKMQLEKPFNNMTILNYVNSTTEEHNCVLMKLKHPSKSNRARVTQRKISKINETDSCSSKFVSAMNRAGEPNFGFFCALEVRNSTCQERPGSVLVCKMKSSTEYFLKGIEVGEKNCKIMFDRPIL